METGKGVPRFGRVKPSVGLFFVLLVFVRLGFGTQPQPVCSASPYDCATQYIHESKYDLAIETIKAALRKKPNDPQALNLLGIALTSKGQIEEADRVYQEALGLDPHFYPALNNLAVNEFHSGHTAEARVKFESVLKSVPADTSANLFMGEILFGEKQCSAAVGHYQKAGDLLSKYPEATLHGAECQLKVGNAKAALSVLKRLPQDDGGAHFRAGKLLVEHHLYADGANEFGIARKTGADPYLAGYNQVIALDRSGAYKMAIRVGNELLNEGYERAELASAVGNAYLKNGQNKEAYNAFRIATHLNPKDEESYLNLCEICLNLKKYDLGLQIADIGLSHLPNSEKLYLERGVIRAMKGQFSQADEDFVAATKLAPKDVLPQVTRGLVAMQEGQIEKSVQLFREAVNSHPDSYLSQYWYAKALAWAGAAPGTKQEQEVVTALKISVRKNPNFWHSRSDLGKALLNLGQVDAAIVQLEKAAKLNPEATAPLYLLGRAYRQKGEVSRARALDARVQKMQAKEREAMSKSILNRALREGVSQSSESADKH